MDNLNEKIKASICLLSYFETLGYCNTSWEFNFGNQELPSIESAGLVNNLILHNFFSLGGFTNMDISSWNASDDTLMMIASGLACVDGGNEKDYIKSYLKILPILKNSNRGSGFRTLNSLDKIKRVKSINKLDYDSSHGGNGAAMRTSVIGLIYYKEEDVDKLIKNSIIASRVTHNYSLGYLGGLITALFTSYAIRDIPVWEWIDKMFELYDSNKIDQYMETTDVYSQYIEEKDNLFFDKWRQYKEQRLNSFQYKPHEWLHFDNRIIDLKKYNFNKKDDINYYKLGASGISCLIVAYDSLLMSYNSNKPTLNLNKKINFSIDSLIYFSTLHFGDNDTTGAIAGAWCGALYGFKYFDEKKINQLEFKEELINLYKKIKNYIN